MVARNCCENRTFLLLAIKSNVNRVTPVTTEVKNPQNVVLQFVVDK
jgi:hypothetical protein